MRAELGNRVVDITENLVDYYRSKGYTVYDDDNKALDPIATDNVSLDAYQKALDKIARLEKELAELKKANPVTEIFKEEAPKAEDEVVTEPTVTEETVTEEKEPTVTEEAVAEEKPAPKKRTKKN